jgi:branched-chain amino acid aminotransferase
MIETMQIEISAIEESKISSVDFDNLKFGKEFADHMFTADYRDGQWQNLKIVPYQALEFSPAMSALHYGQSIFEGLKAYKNAEGQVLMFRPEDNLKRLNLSAERMCMPELPEEIFMSGLSQLLALDKNWVPNKPGASLYIRPFMFATDEYVGIRPSDTYKFVIFTCPVGAYYAEPVRVRIEREFSRSFPGGTGSAKTAGNYAAALYPAKRAQNLGYHQLVWTDAREHKYIEESGTMNIMFLINDTLVTPTTGDTILKGITRMSVLELARKWGVKVEERKVAVDEVVQALKDGTLKEAFGTGTAATIAHIDIINCDGVDYKLPAIEQRKFSPKVLETLDAIKTGQLPDDFGWITAVN